MAMTAEQKKEYRRQYYLKNKEKLLEKSKEWRDNNKERVAALKTAWRKKNKDYVNKKHREYVKSLSPEKKKLLNKQSAEWQKAWKAKNPELAKELHQKIYSVRKENSANNIIVSFKDLITKSRCRARSKGLEHNITVENIQELWEQQQGLCNLSQLPMEYKIGSKYSRVSIDRIDSTKGYVLGNIQLIRFDVNQAKSDHTQEHFIDLCKAVASNN